MKTHDFDAAKAYALKRLALELPPQLLYHSLSHTQDEVVPATAHLAGLEGLGEEATLLLTAAYYHDIGFTLEYSGHETLSVAIARENLPRYGYAEPELEIISRIIMATKLPQSPKTLLEMILADADLSVLGSTNFVERNAALREEHAFLDGPVNDADWYTSQLHFIGSHRYFTHAARASYDGKKQENLAWVKARLAAAHV